MTDRAVTMSDVAKAAGVSRQLVSIAFRDAQGVSPETKEHILSTAKRLGYQRNSLASRLASRESNVIGLYLQDLRNEVFADIHDGLRESLEGTGRHMVLGVGIPGNPTDLEGLTTLLSARVDVLVTAGVVLPDEDLRRVAERSPIVMVSRKVEGLDSVYSDDVLGAYKATKYLLSIGHQRILHLAAPDSDGYRDRRRSFEETMKAAGLEARVAVADYSREAAADVVGPYLDSADPPTAVFAHNDTAALGVLEAAQSRGLSVPRDLSVIGYDNSEVARLPGISLTSVDLHAKQLGRRAGEVALARLTSPSSAPVDDCSAPTLITRGSTAPPAE